MPEADTDGIPLQPRAPPARGAIRREAHHSVPSSGTKNLLASFTTNSEERPNKRGAGNARRNSSARDAPRSVATTLSSPSPPPPPEKSGNVQSCGSSHGQLQVGNWRSEPHHLARRRHNPPSHCRQREDEHTHTTTARTHNNNHTHTHTQKHGSVGWLVRDRDRVRPIEGGGATTTRFAKKSDRVGCSRPAPPRPPTRRAARARGRNNERGARACTTMNRLRNATRQPISIRVNSVFHAAGHGTAPPTVVPPPASLESYLARARCIHVHRLPSGERQNNVGRRRRREGEGKARGATSWR